MVKRWAAAAAVLALTSWVSASTALAQVSPSSWSSGGQCTAAAVLDQLQLATQTSPPFPGSETTHKIDEGCFWAKHPDKWFRTTLTDPNDPLPNNLTIYVCNNCKGPITVGLKDFTNRQVLPMCSGDWPTTVVQPGASAFVHCTTGSREGESTDYVPYAVNPVGQHVGLDPEIVLERDGSFARRLFDLDELGLAVGNRAVIIGRSQASYVNGLRSQGLVVGLEPLPATGTNARGPDVFILIAPTVEDVAFARSTVTEYFALPARSGGTAPRIWMIDAPVSNDARITRLAKFFQPVSGKDLVRLRRGNVALELQVLK